MWKNKKQFSNIKTGFRHEEQQNYRSVRKKLKIAYTYGDIVVIKVFLTRLLLNSIFSCYIGQVN